MVQLKKFETDIWKKNNSSVILSEYEVLNCKILWSNYYKVCYFNCYINITIETL
jgi:hypothetical protein